MESPTVVKPAQTDTLEERVAVMQGVAVTVKRLGERLLKKRQARRADVWISDIGFCQVKP
jgi:hypothetical protein